MDAFIAFKVLVNSLMGLTMFLTGFFLWREFKEDFEMKTLGGTLALPSLISFVTAFRVLFWDLGWVDENLASNIFFVEYILVFFFISFFILPRFLYLVINKPIVEKIGLLLGIGLYVVYLTIHFDQKGEIVAHYTPQGLVFELPYLEKIFLLFVFLFFIPLMFSRAISHFYQWRKKKAHSHRFFIYLSFFFILVMAAYTIFPQFQPWQTELGFILLLAGIFALYLLSYQELIEKRG